MVADRIRVGIRAPARPSQCSISVWYLNPLTAYPTAQTSVAEAAATPISAFEPVPTFGADTALHDEPFQCSIRVEYFDPMSEKPTAHTSVEEIAVTPISTLESRPGLSVGRTVQEVPSQCCATVANRLKSIVR